MTLDTLIGKKITLVAYSNEIEFKSKSDYGRWNDIVTATFVKFLYKKELHIIKICEDQNDGYRSALGGVEFVDATDEQYKLIKFNKFKPAKVRLVHEIRRHSEDYSSREDECYEFVDDTGTVWFSFGTSNIDDYYPSFFCGHLEVDTKAYREATIGEILDDDNDDND